MTLPAKPKQQSLIYRYEFFRSLNPGNKKHLRTQLLVKLILIIKKTLFIIKKIKKYILISENSFGRWWYMLQVLPIETLYLLVYADY